MIKDLIRSIMRENVATSDEDLMADNTDTSIRDAFIGEDGEFDDTSDVTDAKIRDLIKNLPESSSNLTLDEISELSESYLDVFEDADYALESSVSIDSKIRKNEQVIESLTYRDSLTEAEQKQLGEAKRQLSVLTMVKENQAEDFEMETLEESNTIDITMEDTDELALEGKHGPDHPQSLNMRDKEDYERIKGEGGWNDKVKQKNYQTEHERVMDRRGKRSPHLYTSYSDGPTRNSSYDGFHYSSERRKAGNNKSDSTVDRLRAEDSYLRYQRRHDPDSDEAKNQKWVYNKQAEERAKESFIIDMENDILFEENLYIDDEPIHDRYNPESDGSAGVSSIGKYADDEWINDIGVDESDELDLSDMDGEDDLKESFGIDIEDILFDE